MAIIKIKYKSTTGSVPSGLCAGELAVNLVDRRLWVGGTTTTSIELAGLSANTFGALNSFNSGISANGATFSGTVTAPTQTVGTNNTTVATTAFVIANALTSSSAVTGVNGFTGAVGISGGQGITIDKFSAGIKVIRPTINYNYGGLTFSQYKLPTDPTTRGIILKDVVLFQASSSNNFVANPEEMYLATLGSFKAWMNGAGSGTFPLTGLTGTETIPILTEYSGDTLTNNYIGITAFQKIILDGGVTSFNGRTGAVTGASLGANTFTGLQTSATGFSGPLTGTATNASSLGGVAAASYALLASPTFTGTPLSTTAAIGTNTTQIATTAFVQSEIVADTVTSFNGRTGAVQGVSSAAAGTGISVSGATGAVTITNIGVQSFNGATGAVTGASLGANTFSGVQNFAFGIQVSTGATFSNPTTIAHNLTQTGPTRGISAEGFLYVGGGATFNSSVAVTSIISPGATLTIQPGNFGVANRTLRLSPYGQLIIDPALATGSVGGSTPRLVVQNSDNGVGQFQFSGGNLYLGTKTNSLTVNSPVDLIFGNPTTAFTTTLTAPNTATSSKTITLPNATGTMVVDGAANTFTALQSFTAGISASGGVTFAGNVAINGGTITTTAATVTAFNTGAGFTLNIATDVTTNASRFINIATNSPIASGTNTVTLGSGIGRIVLNSSGGITLGQNTFSTASVINVPAPSGFANNFNAQNYTFFVGGVCASSGVTFSGTLSGTTATFNRLLSASQGISASGGATFANALSVAGSLNSTGLLNSTGGISASGGVTFNTPIVSTRIPRVSSAVFDTKTADFSPVEADNGKVFVINISGKTTLTVTLDGLSTGWRAKFLVLGGSGTVFISTTGTVLGTFGADGSAGAATGEMVEVYCYGTNTYFAG